MLMNATCLIPTFCNIFFTKKPRGETVKKTLVKGIFKILALVVQLSAIGIGMFGDLFFLSSQSSLVASASSNGTKPAPTINPSSLKNILIRTPSSLGLVADVDLLWQLPLALVLVSVIWWENFVDMDVKIGKLKIPLKSWKHSLHVVRHKTVVITNLWKIGCTISAAYIFFYPDFEFIFLLDSKKKKQSDMLFMDFSPILLHILLSAAVYYFAGLACKLKMQMFSFSLPLTLATPATVTFLWVQCQLGFMAQERFIWLCPEGVRDTAVGSTLPWQVALLCLWWLSYLFTNYHVWFPESERMAKTDK